MDKKWLPLTITLGVAGVAVVAASFWPDDVESRRCRRACVTVRSAGRRRS